VKCPVEECERRDPKGMYKKAREGKIKQFTGVSSVYEEPEEPEIIIEAGKLSIDVCVQQILDYLVEHRYIKAERVSSR
jgi:adenylylsulfate kinase